MQLGKLLKFTIPAVLFLAIAGQWQMGFTSASGPDPGYTDAPGENGNCTSCHGGSSATTSSSVIKLKTHQSSSVLEYLPDSTYTITVDFSPSGVSKYGFQTTALINSSSKMAGTFTITDATNTKSANNVFSGNTRYYVEQTSTGTSKNSWSFQWKAPSTNVGDITFYVAANAANGNGQSSGDQIHTNSFTFKPSSKLPAASIVSPSSSVNVCVGDSLAFSGSGTNSPLTYKWTFSGGTPSTSTLQNPKVLYKTVGNFSARLSVTNAYGVSTEVVRNISVKGIPADTITVTGSKTLCAGDSVKLTAAIGSKYEWSTGQTTSFIYAKATGDYSVKVTSSFGCDVTSKPVHIEVLSKPTATLSRIYGSDEICEDDSLVLEATAGASVYTFYNGKSIAQQGTSNTYTAKNLTAGNHNFYVLVTDAKGCKSDTSGKIALTVRDRLPAPVLSCGTASTESVTIHWTTVNNATGYEVSTDTGKTWTNTSDTSYTFSNLNADENVQLQVRATDNTACKTGTAGTISCKSLPCSQLTYTILADTVICQGDTASITFDNLSSATYFIRVNGGAATKQSAFFFRPIALDTSISISLYDSTKLNCPAIEHTFRIRTDEMPEMTSDLDKGLYCQGETVQLTTTSGYAQYHFYRNSNLVQTQTGTIFNYTNVADTDTLYVIATTANGCKAVSPLRIVAVAPRTNPGFTFTSDKLAVTFTDTTSLATTRKWNFGDGETSTDINPTHTYAMPGQYTVWLTTTNFQGCTDSVSKTLDVKSVGVQELLYLQEANIYPVPFQSEINVALVAKQASKTQITITDMKGRTVINITYQAKQGKNSIQIPAANLPGGVYILRIQCGKDVITRKITKTRER